MDIGERIRKARKRQGRTLQDVAAACGFTRSLLCKIETGKTVPPVATLMKIAAALGVTPAALLVDSRQCGPVFLSKAALDQAPRVATEKGYAFFPFAADRADKLMQPYLMVAERGKIGPRTLAHAGEEFIYVLEGKMGFSVGQVRYTLSPGDSLYFDAEEAHDLEPLSERVKYLCMFVEPRGLVPPRVPPGDAEGARPRGAARRLKKP